MRPPPTGRGQATLDRLERRNVLKPDEGLILRSTAVAIHAINYARPISYLARPVIGAMVNLPVYNDSGAQAAAHTQTNEIAQSASLPKPEFSQRHRANSVLNKDRHPESLRYPADQRHLFPSFDVLVAQGYPPGRINHPGNADPYSQHFTVVADAHALDGVFNLVQDIVHRFSDGDGVVDLLERPLREIHSHRHDVARLEIHPDETATLRVKSQNRRRPPEIPLGRFTLEEITFLDQVIDIDAYR